MHWSLMEFYKALNGKSNILLLMILCTTLIHYCYMRQVGVAYLLALESANNLTIPPTENIEYDR